MPKSILLFLFPLLCFQATYGQTWKGIVKDHTGSPLPYASIYFEGSTTGTVSLKDGTFRIAQIEKAKNKLVFHHIGYEDVVIALKTLSPNDSLFITLSPSKTQLKEAVIRAQRERKIAGNKNEHVVDFTCLNKDSLVLIVKRQDQRWLQVLVNHQHTMEMQIPHDCNQVATDYKGNIYLQSKNFDYYYVVLSTKLLNKLPSEQFETKILPVVADLGPKLYFGETRKLEQEYTLISFDTLAKQYTTEYTVFDEDQYETNAEWMQRIVSRYSQIVPPENNIILNGSWDGDLVRLIYQNDRTLFEMVSWYKQVIGRAISIGFTNSTDSAYLWDFLNAKKIALGADTAITFEAPILHEKTFKEEVYLDPETNIHYGKFFIHGKTYLNSLTPSDDTYFDFETAPSGKKIEIMNNHCYFIDFKAGSQFAKLYITSPKGNAFLSKK